MNASSGNPAHHSVSIFLTLSIIIFIVSLGGAAFAYVWQNVLNSEQVQYKDDLAKDQNQFNTNLINTLTLANTKIDVAKGLIKNHLATSEIFNIISQLTIASVQWKSFSFSAPVESGASKASSASQNDVTVSMQGETDSYYSVAYQSDVLGNSSEFGTNSVIKNPVLSNLTVGQDGKVNFSFTASVDPSELSYVGELSSQGAPSASSSPMGSTVPMPPPAANASSTLPLTR